MYDLVKWHSCVKKCMPVPVDEFMLGFHPRGLEKCMSPDALTDARSYPHATAHAQEPIHKDEFMHTIAEGHVTLGFERLS